MRWSQAHIPTLRDAPQEAEVVSHQLMLRAGYIRRLASGIYSYLPLGVRVLKKVESIIRHEMNAAGAQEVLLPFVQPKELWEETGRWGLYGKELARLKDRHENEFCLQPTSEEVMTDLVRRDIRSYRQVPVNLYQIQTKFRDEIRPRFGVMRSREFIMKDAYSFDLNRDAALCSYEAMRKAYRRIFTRTGLQFKAVDADTGAIGGQRSEEFTVLAQSGEDLIVSCESCDYGANQEKAEGQRVDITVSKAASLAQAPALEKFATPGLKTINDLAKSLELAPAQLAKTMVATDKDGRCLVLVLRGDDELDEVKLSRVAAQVLGSQQARLASDAEIRAWNLPKGSLGPAKLSREAFILVDSALDDEELLVVGANEEGFHFRNMVLKRDCPRYEKAVLRRISPHERCRRCGASLQVLRGIEVGHVFYLGTKYSQAMKLTVTDEKSQPQFLEMGCYGIGVGRTVAAAIEQNHDKDGIVWPLSIAPYQVGLTYLGSDQARTFAEELYQELKSQGFEVLFDDRDISAGVKLKDADLIGLPVQIIVGDRALKNQKIEFKRRLGQEKREIDQGSALLELKQFLEHDKKALDLRLA